MLLVLLSQGFFISVLPVDKNQQAEKLTQLGYAQLHQGQASEALKTWEAAYKVYSGMGNFEGMSGSLINQSLALQALGLYKNACETLIQSLGFEHWICKNLDKNVDYKQKLNQELQNQSLGEIQIIGLQNLGNVLRIMEKLDVSEAVLQKTLEISVKLQAKYNKQIILSLANTETDLYIQAKNKYQLTEEAVSKQEALEVAKSKFKTAINLYEQLIENPNSNGLQGQLNLLTLLLDGRKSLISNDFSSQIQGLVKYLLKQDFGQLPVIESIYARLNLVQSLVQVSQEPKLSGDIFPNKTKGLNVALKWAEESLQISLKIDNERAKSYALGMMSDVYGELGEVSSQKKTLIRALALAQSVQAWDIAYQWQHQLGRWYRQAGNYEKAIQAYEAAVTSLGQIEGNLLSVNANIKFSFKDKVEPVYQEYIKLILGQKRPNIEQAIEVYEKFRLAELSNFLKCGQSPLITFKSKTFVLTPIIYLMNLGEQIEVIVKIGSSVHHYRPSTKLLDEAIDTLLSIIQNQVFPDYSESKLISYAQIIYNELILPIKKYLPVSGNLVFVPDTYFQNLPLVMLHDGENYLVNKYNISVALGAKLLNPKALEREQMKALIAGVSKINPRLDDPLITKKLSSLPEVEVEVSQIKENMRQVKELLNSGFTFGNFQQVMKSDNLPIVHVTTHGQFSSDPEQTFIVTWDRAVNVRQLDLLLRRRNNPIELLVLSACETARGDRHSALGIAGVAAQAGARSTLATLWQVDADATASVVGEFYKGLKNGLSKTEALRMAQLSVRSNPKYSHPYYWAGYILLGSFL